MNDLPAPGDDDQDTQGILTALRDWMRRDAENAAALVARNREALANPEIMGDARRILEEGIVSSEREARLRGRCADALDTVLE